MDKPDIIPSLWHVPHLNAFRGDKYDEGDERKEVEDYFKANLIGSRYPNGHHAILLDLDCKHEYRESSTPGHGHLVIEPAGGNGIEWYEYRKLLEHLTQLGVIEDANYQLALRREQNFLRTPHVRKDKKGLWRILWICSGRQHEPLRSHCPRVHPLGRQPQQVLALLDLR